MSWLGASVTACRVLRVALLAMALFFCRHSAVGAEDAGTAPAKAEEASSEEWGMKEYLLEGGADTLLVVDWLQSNYTAKSIERDRNAHRPYHYSEANPILGKYPSRSDVNIYFGSIMGAKVIAAYLLPKRWNNTLNIVVIAVESLSVVLNMNAGVSLSF